VRACLNWSGGKDAALALTVLLEAGRYEVVRLLTTVSAEFDRSTTHGVRRALYEEQAAAIGLPLQVVELPEDVTDELYADRMRTAHRVLAKAGIDTVAFGDVFLEDVREYREERLADVPVEGLWPIWQRDTTELVEALFDRGFEATVVCVDDDALDRSFVGRPFDRAFIDDLPPAIDPAGEHGEFHTFVTDGPIFDRPVTVTRGEQVTRSNRGGTFYYCDLVPCE
jgi:uncharacterized protein (TIGR00290 family)